MQSISDNAVYNARIRHMRLRSSRFLAVTCFALLVLIRVPVIAAADWHVPEQQLARQIAAVTGPGAVALELVNRSSLDRAEVDAVRLGFMAELAGLGLRLANADQAAAMVRITLSEDLREYVWVAEIRQGTNESSVVMAATPRPVLTALERPANLLIIHKTLLWTDENRILDVALVNGNPQRMILLEPESVVFLKFQDARWQREQSLPILHPHSWPRDLRGRLVLRKDHLFDAYLPGMFCRSTTAAPLAVNCFESDDPWPLGNDQSSLSAFFAPARNFFTGALSPGIEKQTTLKAFYSAAVLPRDKYKLWIFMTLDGQVHLLDGVTDQAVAKSAWGSDIASVRSGCSLNWQVLVSGNGDGAGEAVRAFEFPDREPIAVSQPVAFSGAITALWADSDGTGAIAVSQTSETGKYEAYRLSISCGQ